MQYDNYYHKYVKYKIKYLTLNEQEGGEKCVKLEDEKYQKRPSPPYHANDCKEKNIDTGDVMDKYSFMLYTNKFLFNASIEGKIFLQHNILPKDKDLVINIFKKYFGKSFTWDGTSKSAMSIKLNKLK